jgi:uncharacterized membrane protein
MTRRIHVASAALAGFAAAMLAANVLIAFSIAHGASMQWRVLFHFVCHGIESRCLVMFGVPLPLCARCTAVYAGIFVGVLLAHLVSALRERTARIIVAIAFVPMGIDGFTQLVRLRESTNTLRVATGLIVGIAVSMWAVAALRDQS